MRNKGKMRVQSERCLDINSREEEGKCWTVVSAVPPHVGVLGSCLVLCWGLLGLLIVYYVLHMEAGAVALPKTP